MYNYDPTEMSRYSSGSMAYFPTSSDPTMGGAMASRDHTSSVFPTQSEQAKFPRGGADLSSAVAVSSTQQNQQGTFCPCAGSISFVGICSTERTSFQSEHVMLITWREPYYYQKECSIQIECWGVVGAEICDMSHVLSALLVQCSGSGLQQQPGAAGQPGSGQMGPAFMGAPFYGSMFYPTMYGPMPAFSQVIKAIFFIIWHSNHLLSHSRRPTLVCLTRTWLPQLPLGQQLLPHMTTQKCMPLAAVGHWISHQAYQWAVQGALTAQLSPLHPSSTLIATSHSTTVYQLELAVPRLQDTTCRYWQQFMYHNAVMWTRCH